MACSVHPIGAGREGICPVRRASSRGSKLTSTDCARTLAAQLGRPLYLSLSVLLYSLPRLASDIAPTWPTLFEHWCQLRKTLLHRIKQPLHPLTVQHDSDCLQHPLAPSHSSRTARKKFIFEGNYKSNLQEIACFIGPELQIARFIDPQAFVALPLTSSQCLL